MLARSREAFDAVPDSRSPSRRSSRSSTPRRSASSTASRSSRSGAGNGARAGPGGRADRVGDRGPHRPLRHVRRRRRAPRRAARAAPRARGALGRRARRHGHASVEPVAGAADHRTPHYRRNDEMLRYVVWRNNSSASTSTSGSTAPTVRSASVRRSATICPSCSRSPRARRSWRASSAGSTRRARRSSPGVPALRDPGRARRLGRMGDVRALPLRDRLDHRAHADLVERAPAPRLPDGGDPDLRRAARPRRVALARGAQLRAGRADRARARRGRAAARAAAPAARGEHVAGDPVRPLGRADRLRRGETCPRARASSGWSSGCGRSPRSSVPQSGSRFRSGTPPSARSRVTRRGASMREIFEEQVRWHLRTPAS